MMKYFADVNPEVRAFVEPPLTAWKPVGERQIPATHALMPRRNIWRARHGDAHNSDEVTTIIGPMLEIDWLSETNYFNPSSSSFDSAGDLYSTPQFPADDVMLIKLDGKNGKLLWQKKRTKRATGGGRPLVLSDPDNPGEEIVYIGEIGEVMAVHTNGELIYHVETGFEEPPLVATFENLGSYNTNGPNYNPINDSLFWATGNGMLFSVDRKTGKQNMRSFKLPGSPAPGKDNRRLPEAMLKMQQGELSYEFDGTPEGYTLAHQLAVVLGENVVNSNFFSIDQRTGVMWITATDEDKSDGKVDGISENGALYRIDVVPDPGSDYAFKMEIGAKTIFKGGSASTAALRADGLRGYLGDAVGNMIAFDYDGNIIWKFSLQAKHGGGADQIGGSIAVSSSNGELYAVTRRDIIKLVDKGDHGELIWRAEFDMYKDIDPKFHQWNLNTAAITPNGIAFLAGVGPTLKILGDTPTFLPVKVGVGLIDRQTGKLRWFADGLDIGQSSLGMVQPTPDGGILITHSPLRRALARMLFGDRIYATRGGMTKYSPIRLDLMLRDIIYAASNKLERGISILAVQPEGTQADLDEVMDLITQARSISDRGISRGDFTEPSWLAIDRQFRTVEDHFERWSVSNEPRTLDAALASLKLAMKHMFIKRSDQDTGVKG